MIAISVFSGGDFSTKIKLAFKIYDLNRDGRVTKKEIEKVITAIYDLKGLSKHDRTGDSSPAHRSQLIMSILDADHNESISEEEFLNGCQNNPKILSVLLPSE